jgi:hypothetical protein
MSFLLSAATVALTEHCDSFSEQLKELINHLPQKTRPNVNLYHFTDEKLQRGYEIGQTELFNAIKAQILEFAEEIYSENQRSIH